jgi:hypothetical protein
MFVLHIQYHFNFPINITNLRNVTRTNDLEEPAASISYPVDRGSKFLRNVDYYVPNHETSHPRISYL